MFLRAYSYGFRPKRRAHGAVAEVRFLTSRSYEWVVPALVFLKTLLIKDAGLEERLNQSQNAFVSNTFTHPVHYAERKFRRSRL